ncbi:MAG: hypothetical protein HOQ09_06460 [Gemmatimonadaceae bacterium]|nr:hypothetical protein [Gemmatimonadaceae bacterium]
MRAYVMTTGVIFALLAVMHVWRVFAETSALARNPEYLVITLIAAALSIWAMLVLRSPAAGSRGGDRVA